MQTATAKWIVPSIDKLNFIMLSVFILFIIYDEFHNKSVKPSVVMVCVIMLIAI